MQTRRRTLALLSLVALAACGNDSDNEAGGGSPDRLVVVGPYRVATDAGETSYRAFALYDDGRPQEDVTDRVEWSSDDESTFTVDGGTITILQGGSFPSARGWVKPRAS